MNDLALDYALRHFDFSIFSRVRLPLLNELLAFRRRKKFYRQNSLWGQKILSDSELDAAAGGTLSFATKTVPSKKLDSTR